MNLHLHSVYSDGKNNIPTIVNNCINKNIQLIGITDHFSDSWKAKVIETLDTQTKITDYLLEISKCQSYLKQTNSNYHIYKGIEIDIGSNESYINSLIHPDLFEIILFEYIENREGIIFARNLMDNWNDKYQLKEKNVPLFGLAHFDPGLFIESEFDILITFMKEHSLFFEFNSRYPNTYSYKNADFFHALRKNNIPVSIGSDSHNSRRLDDLQEPMERIKEYQLDPNLKLMVNLLKNM